MKCKVATEHYEKFRCYYGDGWEIWGILGTIFEFKWVSNPRSAGVAGIHVIHRILESIMGPWNVKIE